MTPRTVLAIVISTLWSVSYVAALISGDYTGMGIATPVMLIAATYLLSIDVRRRNGR